MWQTSLLLMKSLNKTETLIFLFVVCSLFPKAIFLMFICYASPHVMAHHVFLWKTEKITYGYSLEMP